MLGTQQALKKRGPVQHCDAILPAPRAGFGRKRVSRAPGVSNQVHRTRQVHSLNLQKATCLQDHHGLRPLSVEEPRGQSRSGERDGFPETLEQGQFLDHFHIHSGKWVHGKRSRNRDCRWRKWLGSHGSRGFWRKRSRRPGHLLPEHLWGPATSPAILCVTSRAG